MARRARKAHSPSSSESELSDQESVVDNQSDTDLTEFEDNAEQPGDINDAALLFADNKHSPEYYIQQLQNFDETVYTQEDYGKDLNNEYRRISIPILYNFLKWTLNLRRGKNRRRLPGIKCKSSLDIF
ncbi:uncharacterized protein N7498_006394 [Penicillium cinerascens]|uniref:Uncharacterized protein n=1 Tax=Penicillium cinerascens TaxID=70096 RepID=A0A9W9MI53_9EURO|nr:uncharacterized protein N7498_006394 [Penicillium cinerascens]KAJ5201731.1 hypothetical protein N7498_006394 [Penicillium cinerascens]